MSNSFEQSPPSDICLLLRADAEQCWLHREVIPVLHEIEADGELPEEEVGAALAYLEAMWDEATQRAQETDAAHSHLRAGEQEQGPLHSFASRYHAAVRVLRGIVAARVRPFVGRGLEHDDARGTVPDPAHAFDGGLRLKDARPGGCTPRAV